MVLVEWDLEELTRETLEDADLGSPVDPDILADRLGLRVYDGGAGCDGLLIGRRVYIDEHQRPERRAFGLAHEIGHFLNRLHDLPDTERRANYLASALLLPRADFQFSLRRSGWDLLRLRTEYRLASFEAVARRIVALRSARVFIFDKPLTGLRRKTVRSVPYGLQPSEEELVAAAEAANSGAPVEMRADLTAWPVIEHSWIRVITLRSM